MTLNRRHDPPVKAVLITDPLCDVTAPGPLWAIVRGQLRRLRRPGQARPVVPTVNPFLAADGTPEAHVASNEVTVFSILDTGDGMVTSYAFDTTDPDAEVVVLDRFPLGEG